MACREARCVRPVENIRQAFWVRSQCLIVTAKLDTLKKIHSVKHVAWVISELSQIRSRAVLLVMQA
jgi:hypothetical protein